ncbi:MAG: PilN domain-containing protein [Acidobacteria bacterium]|nr:PilN domain-containing protein [Acidobacteriota bacterium]
MIRVNLLRQNVAISGSVAPEKPKLAVPSLALLCVTVIGMGWWWWQLASGISSRQQEVERLEHEAQRLVEVQKQVVQFEKQKKLLEERINIIERLKRNQTGPANLLQSVINSVPNRPTLWLTDLSQKGNRVTMEGRSFDVPSIADFIAALSRSPAFTSVELAYWQEEEPAIRFQLNCNTR